MKRYSSSDDGRGEGPRVRPIVVKTVCVLMVLSAVLVVIAGQSTAAVIHSLVVTLFSLEGYFAARKLNKRILRYYWLFLSGDTIYSVAYALILFNGLHADCSYAKVPDNCLMVRYTQYSPPLSRAHTHREKERRRDRARVCLKCAVYTDP